MAASTPKKFSDFDPEKEPAVVKIRIQPMRYLRVRDHVYAPQRGTEIQSDGKTAGVWKYHDAEVWVPERIANRVTISHERSEAGPVNPIAQVVATRSVEEALAEARAEAGEEVPESLVAEEAPTRRRVAANAPPVIA